MRDTIEAGIGDNADGVAVGKGIRQRIRRTSQNVDIHLPPEAAQSLRVLESEVLQMAMDIKLLYQMSQERHNLLNSLQQRLEFMGVAMLLMSITFLLFLFFTWR